MGYLAKYKLLTLKKADAIIFIRKIGEMLWKMY